MILKTYKKFSLWVSICLWRSRSKSYAMTGDYMESEPFCVYIPKALRKQKKNVKKGHE